MNVGPTSVMEEMALLVAPLLEFLQKTCLLCLVALAAALLLLAISVIGIESRDARKARRILDGDLRVSEMKLHEIEEELEASDSAEHRCLAHELAERFPTSQAHHS